MENISRTAKDFTAEDRDRLVAQQKVSGLDYMEFAREHNINPQTMKNWVWRANAPHIAQKRYSPTEKKKILEAYLSCGMTKDQFCKTWGVSSSTLLEWQARYEERGADGLMNKSRWEKDKRSGMRVPVAVQAEIINIKKAEPTYGLKKIRHFLYRFRGVRVSTGSIRKTVVREGLPLVKVKKKRRKSSDRVRRFERAKPMQLWQSDITQFTLGPSSMRVYLTVFMDDHSRYIVAWRLQSRQTSDLVMDAFKDGVVRYGKPEEVLTDQGRQYFAWRGKSDLEKLLEKEGIKHVVSRAHHPQTLGKCERFWETVMNEFWTRAKPQDLDEARVRLKLFIDHYNHQRPHQGLDGQVPADRFFGVAEEVRSAVEKTVEQNALSLAIGELPKPPAFLIGQVGDQRIAFHGTSGGFYLTHENLNGEKSGESGKDESESRDTIDVAAKEAALSPAKAGGEVPSGVNAGALGECDARGAKESQGSGVCDHELLDGLEEQAGSRSEPRDQADPVLAVDESSGGGNDGGLLKPAALPEGGVNGQG